MQEKQQCPWDYVASVRRKLKPVSGAHCLVARPLVDMTLPLLLERGPLQLLMRASRPHSDAEDGANDAKKHGTDEGTPCPLECGCRTVSAADRLLLLRDLVHELLRLQLVPLMEAVDPPVCIYDAHYAHRLCSVQNCALAYHPRFRYFAT